MRWIFIIIIISASIFLVSTLANIEFENLLRHLSSDGGDSEKSNGKNGAMAQIETTFKDLLDSAKIQKSNLELRGEERDQINFLFLGVGGEEHISGNYLTDTIIFITLIPSTGEVAVISIPRDLMVRSPDKKYFTRINALYEMDVKYIKETVENITGSTVDYYSILDLAGVEKIVDILGGINVRRFEDIEDEKFPDDNYGYETYEIKEGWRYLDGEGAAKYIRTRHTEGGDFDRMKRQQEVALAIKKKIAGLQSLSALPQLLSLYKALQDHFTTDLSFEEIMRLIEISEESNGEEVVFDRITADLPAGSNPDALLVADTVIWGGKEAYVLKPRAGVENYEEIREKVRRIIESLKMSNVKAQMPNEAQNPNDK